MQKKRGLEIKKRKNEKSTHVVRLKQANNVRAFCLSLSSKQKIFQRNNDKEILKGICIILTCPICGFPMGSYL